MCRGSDGDCGPHVGSVTRKLLTSAWGVSNSRNENVVLSNGKLTLSPHDVGHYVCISGARMSGKRVHKDPFLQESHQKTRNHHMLLDLSAVASNNKNPAHHTHQELIESVNPKTPVSANPSPASTRYVSANHYRLRTATHSNVNLTSRTTIIHAASAPSSPPDARPIDDAAVYPSTPYAHRHV